MQIKYYFATEEVTVDVEVSPEIEAYLEESNRLEENYERNNYCFDQDDDTMKKEKLESVSNKIMVI